MVAARAGVAAVAIDATGIGSAFILPNFLTVPIDKDQPRFDSIQAEFHKANIVGAEEASLLCQG
jgi:hypothetical protein